MQQGFGEKPVIVMAAPTGARRTRAEHPRLPMTVEEIAAEARACRDAGAAAFHLHVRDSEGRHSLDPGLYDEAIRAVRAAAGDMVIQITTEAADLFGLDAQTHAIRGSHPDAVSMAFREFAPDGDARLFCAFAAETLARGIAVQVILYAPDEVTRLADAIARHGLDAGKLSLLFVLGRYTPNQASQPRDLLGFLAALDAAPLPFRDMMLCAFGRHEHACVMAGALLGEHVRVGFENNLHLAGGRLATGTHELVQQACGGLKVLGLRPASSHEARALWGLAPA
jgi:uncharacterized protein (DUF849 family)